MTTSYTPQAIRRRLSITMSILGLIVALAGCSTAAGNPPSNDPTTPPKCPSIYRCVETNYDLYRLFAGPTDGNDATKIVLTPPADAYKKLGATPTCTGTVPWLFRCQLHIPDQICIQGEPWPRDGQLDVKKEYVVCYSRLR